MTFLARAGWWPGLGAIGFARRDRSEARARSSPSSDPRAIAPRPTPQSRKKWRRVRSSRRRSGVMALGSPPRDELVEVEQPPRGGRPAREVGPGAVARRPLLGHERGHRPRLAVRWPTAQAEAEGGIRPRGVVGR